MGEYNRLVDILVGACRFCPVCGTEMDVVKVKTTITNSGPANGIFASEDKSCPEGHATLGLDVSWTPYSGNPHAVFELDPEIFVPKT